MVSLAGGIRSRFTPIKEMEGHEDMVVDTRPARRIGKRGNRVNFGKQSNGTLFTVAMSPTSLGAEIVHKGIDYV